MRDLQKAAERHLGPMVDQRHSFGDAPSGACSRRPASTPSQSGDEFLDTMKAICAHPAVTMAA